MGFVVFVGSMVFILVKNVESNWFMVMGVGLFMCWKDGDYDVNYGFYCGMLCVFWYVVVLYYDGKGWYVVLLYMNGIF